VEGKGCTIVLSYKCNRDCFFCYEETPFIPKNFLDPNDTKRIYDLIDKTMKKRENKTVAITG
jgi:molybdenum cofactor biosynthesis enzyme MoaA